MASRPGGQSLLLIMPRSGREGGSQGRSRQSALRSGTLPCPVPGFFACSRVRVPVPVESGVKPPQSIVGAVGSLLSAVGCVEGGNEETSDVGLTVVVRGGKGRDLAARRGGCEDVDDRPGSEASRRTSGANGD